MAKKKDNDWKERLSVVYSTNPDYNYQYENEDEQNTLPPEKQKLIVRTDKRHRKGKTVTIVEGFAGTEEDLKDLAKTLKNKCGTGGSAKEGEIIIQGDLKDKIAGFLQEMGYKVNQK